MGDVHHMFTFPILCWSTCPCFHRRICYVYVQLRLSIMKQYRSNKLNGHGRFSACIREDQAMLFPLSFWEQVLFFSFFAQVTKCKKWFTSVALVDPVTVNQHHSRQAKLLPQHDRHQPSWCKCSGSVTWCHMSILCHDMSPVVFFHVNCHWPRSKLPIRAVVPTRRDCLGYSQPVHCQNGSTWSMTLIKLLVSNFFRSWSRPEIKHFLGQQKFQP